MHYMPCNSRASAKELSAPALAPSHHHFGRAAVTHRKTRPTRGRRGSQFGAEVPSTATGLDSRTLTDHALTGVPRARTRFGVSTGTSGRPRLPVTSLDGPRLRGSRSRTG